MSNEFSAVLEAMDELEKGLLALERMPDLSIERYKLMGYRSYLGEMREKVQSLYRLRQLRMLTVFCGMSAMSGTSARRASKKY